MTNQWFRSWHGAPTDHKWLGIARKAGVAPGIVAAIVWALLDRASQASERGSIAGYDADGLACFMGCEVEQVESVIAIMHEKEILTANAFTGWEKHQPKREDSSTERVKAYRERNETQRNAEKRAETLDTDTDTDTESKKEPRGARSLEFETFWAQYPHKTGKPKARQSFNAARRRAGLDAIMAGLERYIASKPPDREWLNPTTFLNQERWNDQPAAPPVRAGPAAPRINPTLTATRHLLERMNASAASEIEADRTAPRLVAIGSGGG